MIEDLVEGQKNVRALGIRTMAEKRSEEKVLDISSVGDEIDKLHGRVLRLFGNTISADCRRMIGMDLEEYQ